MSMGSANRCRGSRTGGWFATGIEWYWSLLIALPCLTFLTVFKTEIGMPRDWDLLSITIVGLLPLALLLGAFFWKRLGAARRLAALGVFVFLYGAVGLDLIEGRYGDQHHSGLTLLVASRPVRLDIFLLEEVLEMLGLALVLNAFLRHLSTLVSRARRPR